MTNESRLMLLTVRDAYPDAADAVEEALAQAATLEWVRKVYEGWRQENKHRPFQKGSAIRSMHSDYGRALSYHPIPDPDPRSAQQNVESPEAKLRAADARIKELEAQVTHIAQSLTREINAKCDERARAEASIRELENELQNARKLYRDKQDDWHRRQENWRKSSDECLKAAESRVRELEAQVKTVQYAYTRDMAGANANANANAITPAQRAVLDAMAQVHWIRLKAWFEEYDDPFKAACEAELARRAAEGTK